MKTVQFGLFGKNLEIEEEPFSIKYHRVLASARWKRLKDEAMEECGGTCWLCGVSKHVRKLELHHMTYKNLGKETLEDVMLLCTECHNMADTEREKKTMYEGMAKSFKAVFRKAWETRQENITEQKGERYLESTYNYERERASFSRWLFCQYFGIDLLLGDLPRCITGDYIRQLFGEEE